MLNFNIFKTSKFKEAIKEIDGMVLNINQFQNKIRLVKNKQKHEELKKQSLTDHNSYQGMTGPIGSLDAQTVANMYSKLISTHNSTAANKLVKQWADENYERYKEKMKNLKSYKTIDGYDTTNSNN